MLVLAQDRAFLDHVLGHLFNEQDTWGALADKMSFGIKLVFVSRLAFRG